MNSSRARQSTHTLAYLALSALVIDNRLRALLELVGDMTSIAADNQHYITQPSENSLEYFTQRVQTAKELLKTTIEQLLQACSKALARRQPKA